MKLEDAKILIGDDSILARKQLKDVLTTFGGKHFFEAANGQEAIEKFKAEKPDIVLLCHRRTVFPLFLKFAELIRMHISSLYLRLVPRLSFETRLRQAHGISSRSL